MKFWLLLVLCGFVSSAVETLASDGEPLASFLLANREANVTLVRARSAVPAEREAILRLLAREKRELRAGLATVQVPSRLTELKAAALASFAADARCIDQEAGRTAAETALLAAEQKLAPLLRRYEHARREQGELPPDGDLIAARGALAAAAENLVMIDAAVSEIRNTCRLLHNRMDELAFQAGLVPYRSAAPF